MMQRKTFFPPLYIIIILFSLALYPGCSGEGEVEADKTANRKQAVKIDTPEKLVKKYKEKRPYMTNVYRDLVDIGNPAVKPLINGYMGSLKEKVSTTTELPSWYSDVYFRKNIILTLEKIKTPGAVKALGWIVKAKQEYITLRESALHALGKIGSVQAAEILSEAVKYPQWELNTVAFWGLENIVKTGAQGVETAAETLMALLEDQDKNLRYRAARALGGMGSSASDDVVDALVEMLSDKDTSMATTAARTLGKIASERSVDGLRFAIINNDDRNSTEAAAKALGAIAAASSDAAVDALIAGLNFGSRYGRYNTAKELGKINSQEAKKALREVLDDEDDLVRSAALQALRGGGRETREAISRVARSKNTRARYDAVRALAKDSSPEAVTDLIDILQNDSDFNIRSAALSALKKTAGQRLLEVTKIALKDKYYSIRADAVHILAEIDSPEAFALLTGALEDKNRMVQEAAIWRLREKKSPEAFDVLIRFLTDQSKDSMSRTKAVQALENAAGSKKALNALISILSSDSDSTVSRQAAWTLSHFKTPSAESALINALKNHKSSIVRSAACSALGQFGTPPAIDALISAFKDKDRIVRIKAIWALEGPAKADTRTAAKLINALVALYEEEEVEYSVNQAATTLLSRLGTSEAKAALEKIRKK
ncbi:MAG: HEAT repeat domain-containing protein [Candidatus Aminicenantes bacterium]|nr:MAG: HEAT repeat domain-containing protein [Candidatus Aminicenantes bacterium]